MFRQLKRTSHLQIFPLSFQSPPFVCSGPPSGFCLTASTPSCTTFSSILSLLLAVSSGPLLGFCLTASSPSCTTFSKIVSPPPALLAMDASSSSNSRKRQRQNSSASNHATNADDPFPPLDLNPFNCTRKLKDMNPTDLTCYFPHLPEKTQYFDMGRIVDNKLEGKPYYTEDLLIWREASMQIV